MPDLFGFETSDEADALPLDLSVLGMPSPQRAAPPQAPQIPAAPKKGSGWAQAALAALIPIAAKRGGMTAVAGLLQGMQQAQAKAQATQQTTEQQRFENERLLAGDQRAQSQMDATEQYRTEALAGQQQQRKAALMKEAATAIQNAESPEAVRALLDFYNPQLAQLGTRTGALDNLALQVATPSRLEQKAAQKYITTLEKTYGTDWAQKVGSATFKLPNAEQPITVQQLLAKAGTNMDGLPVNPLVDKPATLGSFEDYVQRYANDNGLLTTEPEAGPSPRGLLQGGNVNLRAQPVVKNLNGTTSTVDSFSVNFDGKEYLLPTVTPDGRHLSQDAAIQEFQRTGRHLGVFDSPENATAFASQLHNDYAAGKYGKRVMSSTDIEAARKRYQQADDRPRVTVTTGGLDTATARRVDAKTRAFDGLPIVKTIQKQAEAAAFAESLNPNTTNPADDQALIYAFAKAMDPDSVVREGEYATVQHYAQSWAETFGFSAARIFSNTAFLTPQARANMKKTIRAKYQAGLGQYTNVRRSYASQINRITRSADGDEYLTDYASGFAPPPATAPSAGVGASYDDYLRSKGKK